MSFKAHVGVDYGFIPNSKSMRGGAETNFSLSYPIGRGWFGGGGIQFSKYIALGEGDYRVNFLGGGLHLEGQPLGRFWKAFWTSLDFSLSRAERRRNSGKESAIVSVLALTPYLVVASVPGASFLFESSATLSPGKKYLWSSLGFGIGVVFKWPIEHGLR